MDDYIEKVVHYFGDFDEKKKIQKWFDLIDFKFLYQIFK